jgi:hypothetical protein
MKAPAARFQRLWDSVVVEPGRPVDGAIGFWALLPCAARNAAVIASTRISLETRCTFDLEDEAFKGGLVVACIGYISRKLRIIWCPPSVSTLSGWNCTPSTGKLRWRNPIITLPEPFSSGV